MEAVGAYDSLEVAISFMLYSILAIVLWMTYMCIESIYRHKKHNTRRKNANLTMAGIFFASVLIFTRVYIM